MSQGQLRYANICRKVQVPSLCSFGLTETGRKSSSGYQRGSLFANNCSSWKQERKLSKEFVVSLGISRKTESQAKRVCRNSGQAAPPDCSTGAGPMALPANPAWEAITRTSRPAASASRNRMLSSWHCLLHDILFQTEISCAMSAAAAKSLQSCHV